MLFDLALRFARLWCSGGIQHGTSLYILRGLAPVLAIHLEAWVETTQ